MWRIFIARRMQFADFTQPSYSTNANELQGRPRSHYAHYPLRPDHCWCNARVIRLETDMGTWLVSFISRTPCRKKAPVIAFTDPIYMVWFLIEEHLSVIHTSHVPLVCVPCEPHGSALTARWVQRWSWVLTTKKRKKEMQQTWHVFRQLHCLPNLDFTSSSFKSTNLINTIHFPRFMCTRRFFSACLLRYHIQTHESILCIHVYFMYILCVSVCVCERESIHSMRVCVCEREWVRVFACMRGCAYVRMCVCVCVCIHTQYTYMYKKNAEVYTSVRRVVVDDDSSLYICVCACVSARTHTHTVKINLYNKLQIHAHQRG